MRRVEIQLGSRGGLDNRLVRIGDESSNQYQLKTEYNYRCGIIEGTDEEYSFIDPAGGPFIAPGCSINGHVVKSIRKGAIIEFEE